MKRRFKLYNNRPSQRIDEMSANDIQLLKTKASAMANACGYADDGKGQEYWIGVEHNCEERLKELVSLDDAYKIAVETKEAKHALWMSRARTAHLETAYFISDMCDENATAEESVHAETMSYKWQKVKQLCTKKAKEYE